MSLSLSAPPLLLYQMPLSVLTVHEVRPDTEWCGGEGDPVLEKTSGPELEEETQRVLTNTGERRRRRAHDLASGTRSHSPGVKNTPTPQLIINQQMQCPLMHIITKSSLRLTQQIIYYFFEALIYIYLIIFAEVSYFCG